MVIRFLATLLLVQSSSIEPKCFGSGYKPEPAEKKTSKFTHEKHEIYEIIFVSFSMFCG